MNNNLSWGIIGCGRIAEKFAREVQLTPCNTLVAVGSRDRDKAAAFTAAHCPSATAHGNYAALVADPAVQAVYIATPHSHHAANSLLAIHAGKHVLVEKPFALNAAEARLVIAAAHQRGVFCGEAMWTRFLPVMANVRSWMRNNAIGSVKNINADFSFRTNFNPEHRLFSADLAGGALLDVGCYPLALVQDLIGRLPDTIIAKARFAPNGVDAATTMSCEWIPEAVRGQLTCALNESGNQGAFIMGTTGTIEIPTFHKAEAATLRRADGSIETVTGAAGFQFEIQAAARAITTGTLEFDLMPQSDSMALITALDSIRAQIGLRYPGE